MMTPSAVLPCVIGAWLCAVLPCVIGAWLCVVVDDDVDDVVCACDTILPPLQRRVGVQTLKTCVDALN